MRMPEYQQVDKTGLATMRSLAAARASMLREIATRQHALMSGFGGHPEVFSCYVDGLSSATTRNMLLRVPPGVKDAQVGVLVRGRGSVVLTTSTDTSGVLVRVSTGIAREVMRWYWTSLEEGTTANDNRMLRLLGAGAESWATISGTITADGPEVFAIALVYQHRAR